jgi:hypothetical protein
MKASERNIIMRRLISAYNKLGEAQKQNRENRSERFPMLSQELIRAQTEYDTLWSLAYMLDIEVPFDRHAYREG